MSELLSHWRESRRAESPVGRLVEQSRRYFMAALLVLSACGSDKPVSLEVIVPPAPEMTEFSIDGLSPPAIDHEAGTITFTEHGWIDNLEALTATFSAAGPVTVNGEEQASGASVNNFYRDIQYTVTTGKFSQRTYTVRVDAPQATGLPVVRIDTEGNAPILSKETYLQTNITVIDPDHPEYSFEHANYKDQVRGRGNSTWGYPKKPYRIKFDKKTSMFGLTPAKSWVLLANYQDPTLIENIVTLELGQRFGLPFTNHYMPVEVFVNGEYQGSYTLTEQVQVGDGRVEVDEDSGFLVELDTYYDEDPKFTTAHYALPVMIKSPEDLSDPSGYDFVKDSINALESALVDASFPDSGYRDLIEVGTFIDFLMINEIVRNNELFWPKSTYMYKDVDGRIGMGPLWDFDWAFGYTGVGHVYFDGPTKNALRHPFFMRFFEDPAFVVEYQERWSAMRDQIGSMPDFISELGQKLERSQAHNFWKWPEAQNNGHAAEIGAMAEWLPNRIAHFDSAIATMQ